jgi:glycosyltransferase 2 family protein
LIMLLKVGISAAIIGWLVYDATQTKDANGANVFTNLVKQPKRWDLLTAGWACCFAAVLITFIRWWFLVCALDIPLRFRDSIRIGFWGYLFNWAPLGIVGGDVVKTVMLDHQFPRNRAKALASVLVDRVIGLYVLFVVASVGVLATQFWVGKAPEVFTICMVTLGITVGSTAGLAVVLGPEALVSGTIRMVGRIPRLGPPLESVMNAVRMYNRKPGVLVICFLLTIPVHCLCAIGLYLVGCGLFQLTTLSLAAHFVVVPLSSAMQVIPVPMGPTEFFLNYLYPTVGVGGAVLTKGQGLLVALAYRLVCLLIVASGAFYYFGNRREMAGVIHEAEAEEAVG